VGRDQERAEKKGAGEMKDEELIDRILWLGGAGPLWGRAADNFLRYWNELEKRGYKVWRGDFGVLWVEKDGKRWNSNDR